MRASPAPSNGHANPMMLPEEAWRLVFGEMTLEEGLSLLEMAEKWHYLPSADANRFQTLIAVDDLDAFLRTDAARVPRVSMADSRRQDSHSLPKNLYSLADGRIDTPRLLACFDHGATLIVSQYHELHQMLAGFCRGLEKALLCAVQANVYLTPSGGQGFRIHYDTHDVFILQVKGEKLWKLWPNRPLTNSDWLDSIAF